MENPSRHPAQDPAQHPARGLPAPPALGAAALPPGTYEGQVVLVTGGGSGLVDARRRKDRSRFLIAVSGGDG
ncbi:hypothetical protein ACWCY1_34680, partial [Streptomyces goshikiensis]